MYTYNTSISYTLVKQQRTFFRNLYVFKTTHNIYFELFLEINSVPIYVMYVSLVLNTGHIRGYKCIEK